MTHPDSSALRPSATERLALSRERIRLSLRDADGPRPGAGEERPSVLITALMAIPGARIVVDAVRSWWSQHPLHLAGLVAAHTARGMVRPMAKRSPYSLVIAAMAVGGLLFWVKPWRGLLKPALLAGLMPHLVSRAVAHVPLESWLSALMTMATQQPPASSYAEPGAGPAAAPATSPAHPIATPLRTPDTSGTLH